MGVGFAAFAEGAVEEVAAVELDAWLCGGDAHDAPACGGVHFGNGAWAEAGATVEHPVVVVARAVGELFVRVLDAFADGVGRSEVERCPGDFADFSCGDEAGVDGGVVRCGDA